MTILSREHTAVFVSPGQTENMIAVTYLTELGPPRTLNMAPGLYRAATQPELVKSPRARFIPNDEPARDSERKAIADDVQLQQGQRDEAFELP